MTTSLTWDHVQNNGDDDVNICGPRNLHVIQLEGESLLVTACIYFDCSAAHNGLTEFVFWTVRMGKIWKEE